MQFHIGQVVTHPYHGPVTVAGFFERQFKGQQVKYIELEVQLKELTLRIPEHKTEEIGLRPLMTSAQYQEVLDVLAVPTQPNNDSWAHRIKEYQQFIHEGTNETRATVVREIVHKHGANPSPGTERTMLLEALDVLSAEAAVAFDRTAQDIKDDLVAAAVKSSEEELVA